MTWVRFPGEPSPPPSGSYLIAVLGELGNGNIFVVPVRFRPCTPAMHARCTQRARPSTLCTNETARSSLTCVQSIRMVATVTAAVAAAVSAAAAAVSARQATTACSRAHGPDRLQYVALLSGRAAGVLRGVQVRAPCSYGSDAPWFARGRHRFAIERPLAAPSECLLPHPPIRRFRALTRSDQGRHHH